MRHPSVQNSGKTVTTGGCSHGVRLSDTGVWRLWRTATSDFDFLLIGDDLFTDDSSSLAAAYDFENEVFEAAGFTRDAVELWARRGG